MGMLHHKTDPSLSRRSFGWISLGILAGGVLLLFKVLYHFLTFSFAQQRPAPFTVKPPSSFPHLEKEVWLARDKKGVMAFSAICPHLGCKPRWRDEFNKFICPCHGSTFAPDGSLLRGPATRGLDRVWIELTKQGMIRVDPTRTAPPDLRLSF